MAKRITEGQESRQIAQLDAINDPGTRQKGNATVIQFARRSEQVELIATAFQDAMRAAPEAAHCPEEFPITIDHKLARKLRGYTEQLLIIADELAKAGK